MKSKVTKDIVPDDFTLSLAIVDAIPVVTFCISMLIIGKIIESKLFALGALLCFCAGAAKVIWKIIVVINKKNIWFFFVQMRIIMPIGLLIIIISLFINSGNIAYLINGVTSMPSLLFFVFGLICMGLMLIFGFVLDGSKSKNNWIEQCTNIVAQLCFLIGLMIVK